MTAKGSPQGAKALVMNLLEYRIHTILKCTQIKNSWKKSLVQVLPKQLLGWGTKRAAATIVGAAANIALTITSSTRRMSNEVSLPSARRFLNSALRVHLWPTSSASGSSLLHQNQILPILRYSIEAIHLM